MPSALNAFQAGLDHFPVRAVDHDRHAGNVRLRRDVMQKRRHGLLGIEHGFVHVDVDDLRAVFDLLPGHRQRRFVLAAENQLGKFRRAGDVRAFADVDEAGVRPKHQRLESAESRVAFRLREDMRLSPRTASAIALMCAGVVPQQPAGDIQPAARRKIVQVRGHRFRRLIESAKCVGKPRVRVATDVDRREMRKLLDIRPHLLRAERAVDAHAQQVHVRNRNPERFDGLPGKRAAALVRDGDRTP